jgi:AraC-like DNA-binding protein
VHRVVFSSADLPSGLDDRVRLDHWRNLIMQKFGKVHIAPLQDRPFSARSELVQFGAVGIGRHEATISRSYRTSADIAADGVDHLMFGSNCNTATIAVTRGGRETSLDPGRWTLLSLSDSVDVRGNGTDWLTAIIPRRQLLELVAGAEDVIGALADPGQPAIRHLRRYLGILLGPDGVGEDPALIAHIGTTLLDLTALALGASGDGAAIARMRGLRAARIQEIIAEIRSGFADPSFSPIRVARKLGLSPRYVQDLLQESSTSFTERVLELRLQKARAMLADRRNDRLKVSDIAYACGFNHVPYFNRCFRARFGDSPTSFRGKPD